MDICDSYFDVTSLLSVKPLLCFSVSASLVNLTAGERREVFTFWAIIQSDKELTL